MKAVRFKDLKASFFVRAGRLYYRTDRSIPDGYISCGVPLDSPDKIREMYGDEVVYPVDGGKIRKIISDVLTKFGV